MWHAIFVLSYLSSLYSSYAQNARPFVGIVSIPSEIPFYSPDEWSYFPASYVKFLESAGAEVVPVQFDLPRKNMTDLLDQLNGVLFTGGDSVFIDDDGNLTPIAESLEFIVQYVMDHNLNGNHYPLWGTCQGFEVIAMIMANNFSLLTNCTDCLSVDKNNFINPDYDNRLFSEIDSDLRQKLAYANLSRFSENFKLDIAAFSENPNLGNTLKPVSYTYDGAGVKYVSSYESPEFPIYATQFHQEISTYEWRALIPANHGYDAVRLQQYLSNFFMNEVRKNNNSFPDSDMYTIDNYNTTIPSEIFNTVYLFPALDSNKLTKRQIRKDDDKEKVKE